MFLKVSQISQENTIKSDSAGTGVFLWISQNLTKTSFAQNLKANAFDAMAHWKINLSHLALPCHSSNSKY